MKSPSRGRFAGVRLKPNVPFDLVGHGFIPDRELFRLTHLALAEPAVQGTSVTVSLRRHDEPDLVLCTLRASRPHQRIAGLMLQQRDEAVLHVTGAAVDVCGFFAADGRESSEEEDGDSDGSAEEEAAVEEAEAAEEQEAAHDPVAFMMRLPGKAHTFDATSGARSHAYSNARGMHLARVSALLTVPLGRSRTCFARKA
jgi:hypothetical protein